MYSVIKIFLISALFSLISCIKHEEGKRDVTAGYWGNLTTVNDFPDTKLFLIKLTKKQNYRICLPKYLTKKYVGIEDEIKASVHIWGYYIGRDVSIKIHTPDLPEIDQKISAEDIVALYTPLCPKGSDLIIGEAYFSDNTLGQTSYSYKISPKGNVIRSTRGLFLKKYDENQDGNWITLSQYLKKSLSEEEILKILKDRDKVYYLDTPPMYITLVTLAHEFGHIWGMCDQYDLGLGRTNCDANHSSLSNAGKIHLDYDSTMSSASWENKIFLTDDDIEGIRHLANRKESSLGYPSGDDLKKIEVTKRPDPETIPVLKLKSVTIEGDDVKFDFALVTTAPIKIEYKYFEKGTKESTVEFNQEIDEPVARKSHKFTGTLKSNRKITWDHFEITFQALSENGEPIGYPFLIEYKVPEGIKKVP